MTVAKLPGQAQKDFTILTISGAGAITPTQGLHTVAAAGGGADDLDTINITGYTNLDFNSIDYNPILILRADVGDVITMRHQQDNIYVPGTDNVILTENNMAIFAYDRINANFVLFNAVGQAQTYTVTNGTPDRTFDADASSTAELADVLYTLLLDLASMGLLKQA